MSAVFLALACEVARAEPSTLALSDALPSLGSPETTFTIPVADRGTVPGASAPDGGPVFQLYLADVQAKYSDIAWAELDRLYIPNGTYKLIYLGGLPERAGNERPLVITNAGGQVRVGGFGHYYVFVIKGGSGWVLTSRYDGAAQTGAAGFSGGYGDDVAVTSATRSYEYGIVVDDAFSRDGVSCLAVGGGATRFVIDHVELARCEFAGLLVKTDDEPSAQMDDVLIANVLVRDVGSECLYLGSTQGVDSQHPFTGLRVLNNRFLRCGTEAIQALGLNGTYTYKV
jgi:hypothetical protein